MDIKVTIKPSFASIGKAIGNVDFKSLLSDTINKAAFSIERFGKQLSPVDTGRLKSSIHTSPASPIGLQAIVATGTNYALFVHEGTRYMRGRPFMEEGAKWGSKSLEGDVSGRIDQEFIKAFKKL